MNKDTYIALLMLEKRARPLPENELLAFKALDTGYDPTGYKHRGYCVELIECKEIWETEK